ncbi:MAG TPA: ABC-2 family transporter protein [Polyangiaceae bacterium]|nr:ABC-2 family transporter protein [Polyangiaceae bacterium]
MNPEDAMLPWPARLGWRGLDKYLALAALSFRQRLDERATLVGSVLFYALILLIYSRLWGALLVRPDASALGDSALGQSPGKYVWYMAVTEWIMLAQPRIYLEIESDVRSGDVAYQLSRPLSYVGAKIAAALGEIGVRWLLLAASGLAYARLFSGEWPSGDGLLLAMLAGVLASLVMMLAHVAIGLSAFWLHDCMPVYLIWQKLSFVLGGLMLPLGIYPAWLRAVAELTPFSALLYGPGQLVVQPDPAAALRLLLTLLAWGGVGLGGVLLLEQRARRNLCLHGG